MSNRIRATSLIPAPPPILMLVGVGLLAGLVLGWWIAPSIATRLPAPWRPVLELAACAGHGIALALTLALAFEGLVVTERARSLTGFGTEPRADWAQDALDDQIEDFQGFEPTPEELSHKLNKMCDHQWKDRLERRFRIYIAVAFLLGLPGQWVALGQLRSGGGILPDLRLVVPVLLIGTLEVVAIALGAMVLHGQWIALLHDWSSLAIRVYARRNSSETGRQVGGGIKSRVRTETSPEAIPNPNADLGDIHHARTHRKLSEDGSDYDGEESIDRKSESFDSDTRTIQEKQAEPQSSDDAFTWDYGA